LVDPTYESGPIRECNYLGIPVVAMVDSTSDPSYVDYPIPANDDAIRSIKLIVSYISERIAETDSIFKIKHELKDYSEVEVETKRIEGLGQSEQNQELIAEESIDQIEEAKAKSKSKQKSGGKVKVVKGKAPAKKGSRDEKASAKQSGGGILSKYQEGKEKSAKARK
ncbi:MAG: 30S ribosomal protein S2, partial [Candidatus Dojkabacteria bacterium]